MSKKIKNKIRLEGAYSILELIIVLGILAALSSFLSLGLGAEISQKKLKKSAKIIEGEILIASELAKELGESVFIDFRNKETNSIKQGEIALMAREILKVKKLPKNLVIDSANFSVFKNRAHFFKEGNCSPGTISIKEKESHNFCDLVLSLTGKVKIICH